MDLHASVAGYHRPGALPRSYVGHQGTGLAAIQPGWLPSFRALRFTGTPANMTIRSSAAAAKI